MYAVVGLALFALFVVTLIDVLRRDEASVRLLPKVAWVFVVILIPVVGSVLWWALGREPGATRVPAPRPADHRPAPIRPVDTRSTEQQLADLEREEREEALRAELARRRREKGLDPA